MILLIKVSYHLFHETNDKDDEIIIKRHNTINSDEELVAVIGAAIERHKTIS